MSNRGTGPNPSENQLTDAYIEANLEGYDVAWDAAAADGLASE